MFSNSVSHIMEGKKHRCVIKLKDVHWHLTVDTLGDTRHQAFALALSELIHCTSLNRQKYLESLA